MMPGTRVYFGNLNRRVREDDIEYFFRRYGRISAISLKITDKKVLQTPPPPPQPNTKKKQKKKKKNKK